MNDAVNEILCDIKKQLINQNEWNDYVETYIRIREQYYPEISQPIETLIEAIQMEPELLCQLVLALYSRVKREENDNIKYKIFYKEFRDLIYCETLCEKGIDYLLTAQGIRKVVIYGAGVHGEILGRFLKKNGVDLVCFIDKNINKNHCIDGVSVLHSLDNIPPADLWIVSPYDRNGVIIEECKKYASVEVKDMQMFVAELVETVKKYE